MNRFTRRDVSASLRPDDESDYERQTLIDNDELCDDEVNLFSTTPLGIRNRQSINKFKSISTMDDEDNNLELRNINKSNKTRDLISEPFVEYTYYDIQPGDSLQSICLRYACSVNQVKRLNGLMTNQEFYGLRRIKLPLGKLGLLEDILKRQQGSTSNTTDIDRQLNLSSGDGRLSQPRVANSPGFALSVSTKYNQHFKPLLSPGFSSDRINDLDRSTNHNQNQSSFYLNNSDSGSVKTQLSHSHSFSNIRDFAGQDINIDISAQSTSGQHYIDTRQLKQQSFIIADLNDHRSTDIDDLLTIGNDNVEKVFQDLDYHVERAKVAAESYDQRAAEIADKIDVNGTAPTISSNFRRTRVSRIPELFFCNENFGLSHKKLVVFIIVVLLVVPLVTYINQTNVATTQSHKLLHE